MTAAKVLDIIARLLDSVGQASGAVSAYTQVKMEDAPPEPILPQAISCSNVRGVFPVLERFWFCFVQVSTTKFLLFPTCSHGTCE